MASSVVALGAGVALGYLLRDSQLSDADRVAREIGSEHIEAFGRAFGSVTLDVARVSVASISFLIGELPLMLIGGGFELITSVFEWGVVRPLELGVGILSVGMEAVAHTISLMVLGFIFFPIFFPFLFVLPVILPFMLPVVVMSAIFKEAMRPYRLFA